MALKRQDIIILNEDKRPIRSFKRSMISLNDALLGIHTYRAPVLCKLKNGQFKYIECIEFLGVDCKSMEEARDKLTKAGATSFQPKFMGYIVQEDIYKVPNANETE